MLTIDCTGRDACVLTGDFNIQPDSDSYTLLTTGALPKTTPFYPQPTSELDSWRPVLPLAFSSAYAQVDSHEPEITNFSESAFGPFAGTLDYVFLTNCRAKEVLDLPSEAMLRSQGRSLPSAIHPSDHLPIGALIHF